MLSQFKKIALCTAFSVFLITPNTVFSAQKYTIKISRVASSTHFNKSSNESKPKKINNIGIASWYGYESGPRYKRKPKTANGEIFSPHKLTAAHRSLPFGTKVLVTNLKNKKSVEVVINDRGPYAKHRLIDLSKSAAAKIGISGIQKVSLTII